MPGKARDVAYLGGGLAVGDHHDPAPVAGRADEIDQRLRQHAIVEIREDKEMQTIQDRHDPAVEFFHQIAADFVLP